MTVLDPEQEKARQEADFRVRHRIAYASGLFQGDVTMRTLLESLAEGVVIVDGTGTILLANACAERMFGYEEKSLIGQPHALLIPERFRGVHEGHQARYFAEPTTRPMGQLLDLAGRRQDGSEFPVELSLSVIETGGGVFVMAFVSDVTLRKQYERHLLEGERRFTAFMLNLPAAAWMKDLQGRYLYANAEAERIFSTPLSELQGKTDEEIFPPEAARQFRENDLRVLAEGVPLQTVEVLPQDNGIDHQSLVSKFFVPGLEGDPAYLAGVAFDITELKAAEQALRESEEKFSKIFDTAPAGITISTLSDGRFIDINREGERLSGFRRDEVVGRTAQEFYIWKDPAERARMIKDLQQEGTVRDREMTFHDKAGNLLSGLFSATVIDIQGKQHLLSIVSDITEHKKAEQDRTALLIQLETVLENIVEGVIIADASGFVLAMNKEALALHGYGSVEKIRRPLDEYQDSFELFDLEGQPVPLAAWPLNRTLRGERFADYELRVRNKETGSWWIASYSGSSARSSSDARVFNVVTVRDISVRKRAEAAIETLNKELMERTIELEATNKELEAFNYSAAHDLRQPLNMIGSYCQAIKMKCGDLPTEEGREYLRLAYESTLRMDKLIGALLKFSQMGRIELHREPVDLSALARETAAMLRAAEPGRQVEFRVTDGIAAHADPGLVRVVLDNLLGNAWKFTALQLRPVIEFGATQADGGEVFSSATTGPVLTRRRGTSCLCRSSASRAPSSSGVSA